MIRIGISAAFEKAVRANPGYGFAPELIALIDAERGREQRKGLSYQAIVTTLQSVMGSRLLLPPNPARSWIARITRRINELGYGEQDLRTLGERVLAGRKGNVELEWLIYRGLYLGGIDKADKETSGLSGSAKVTLGRGDEESE